ncbi:MAG: hypothetical protein LIP23_04970 [Planctomycetes bacterium]|nr:hypothetical protein [Planctomycetota bacterium]
MSSEQPQPYFWVLDSEREPLAGSIGVFELLGDMDYVGPQGEVPDWEERPDAVFVSAELPGGSRGDKFARLVEEAGQIPILVVARLRSLAQAVGFFRAGARDYLSLPLDAHEAEERLTAAMEETVRQQALHELLMQLADTAMEPAGPDDPAQPASDDILAALDEEIAEVVPDLVVAAGNPALADLAARETAAMPLLIRTEENGAAADPMDSADTTQPDQTEEPERLECEKEESDESEPPEEPEAVDGLPIPTLWEELPCGLLVFDSNANLVFSNSLALELFGKPSLAELQDALENDIAGFSAYGNNHKPLPDNQWPQAVAAKTKLPRSAVISIEHPDRRRQWLRIDCLPHLHEGKVTRLSMTLVNLTGEIAPLDVARSDQTEPVKSKKEKAKSRGKKKR